MTCDRETRVEGRGEGTGSQSVMDWHPINPLTPKISLVILLTVCHTVLVVSVWRISVLDQLTLTLTL